MQAVILAAGLGTRLFPYTREIPKPLLKVGGRELLFRHLFLLSRCGIKEFVLVINPRYEEQFNRFLKRYPQFSCQLVVNPYPEKGNGYSFFLAREKVTGPFVLVMGDHVYEPDFVFRAVKLKGLVVDPAGRFIDPAEATKALCKGGRIQTLDKALARFSGFDTGFFVLTPEVFEVAERLLSEREELSLSRIMSEAEIPCSFLEGLFWMDIDTPEDLKKAHRFLIRQSVKGASDGLISRWLNRRLSTWLSEKLVDRISPNQATVFSTLLGFLAAFLLFWEPALGGVVYQISSVLDGIDGEIARVSLRESPFGGWLDSVLDRLVDFVFLWALALVFPPANALWWSVFLWALFGSVMVSYTSERFKGAFGKNLQKELTFLRFFPGKRDERVFLIMILLFLEKIKLLYLLLAFLTNLRVFLTVIGLWRLRSRAEGHSTPLWSFGLSKDFPG